MNPVRRIRQAIQDRRFIKATLERRPAPDRNDRVLLDRNTTQTTIKEDNQS